MKLFYLDDSGSSGLNLDDKEQPLFVLGGIVIDDSQWRKVEQEVQSLKDTYGIGECEIHALEIANGKGAFKDWSYDKKQEFITKCLQLIPKLGLTAIHFNVVKSNYKRYFERFSKAHQQMVKIPPYIIAYSYILQIAERYLQAQKANGILIADEQDTHLIANDTLKVLRAINEPEIKVFRIVEKSFFTSSKDSNLLQLADIFVYYVKRYYEIEVKPNLTDKSIDERRRMFKIVKDSVYKAHFDYKTHKILGFIRQRLDE